MPRNKIFRLRPAADRDLEEIHKYSDQEFGSARADEYIKDLDIAFHKLADNPSLGSDYSHIRPGLLAYRVVSHMVFFKPSVEGIIILRVLHQSMDYERHV